MNTAMTATLEYAMVMMSLRTDRVVVVLSYIVAISAVDLVTAALAASS